MKRSVFPLVPIAFLLAEPGWVHHNMSAEFDFNQRLGKWQISRGGANGAASWRQDGKELLYVREKIETPQLDDVEVIAVDVMTSPSFDVLDSRVLFELSIPPIGDAPESNASADGQRFVFTLPVTD